MEICDLSAKPLISDEFRVQYVRVVEFIIV